MISKLEKIGLYKNAGIFLSIQTIWTNYQVVCILPTVCIIKAFLLVQVIQIRNSTHEYQINSARFIVKKELLNRPYLLSKQQQTCIYFLLLYFFFKQKLYLYLDQFLHAHKKAFNINSFRLLLYIHVYLNLHNTTFFFNLTSFTVKHFDLSKPQHVPLFQISLRTVE